MLTEIREQRKLELVRPYYWRGIRTFRTTDPVDDAAGLLGEPFPGSFPDNAPPLCARAEVHYDAHGMVGKDTIYAVYESTGVGYGRWLTRHESERYERAFVPGKEGVYEGSPTITSVIQGREPDGIHEWQVVRGSPVWFKSFLIARLDTSYNIGSVPYEVINATIDCVNSDDVTILGSTAHAGELWLQGVTTSRERFGNIVDVSYIFAWTPSTSKWTERVLSRRGVWMAVERPVIGQDGAPTGETRRTMTFMPGKQLRITNPGPPPTYVLEDSPAAAPRKVMPEASFEALGLGSLKPW